MKISINSKLKQISQGKKKIKYFETENTELATSKVSTSENQIPEKDVPKVSFPIEKRTVSNPDNLEKQTYKFLEKLNVNEQAEESKTSRINIENRLQSTSNEDFQSIKTENKEIADKEHHHKVKYAKTKDKFKTTDHSDENKLDEKAAFGMTINTTRHISIDKIKSPRSPNTVERINSAKFLIDANEQIFIGEEELSQVNSDIHSFCKSIEIVGSILTRHDDLLSLYIYVESKEEYFKQNFFINKPYEEMDDEEQQRMKYIMKVNLIKNMIGEKCDIKGSKLAPLGSSRLSTLNINK